MNFWHNIKIHLIHYYNTIQAKCEINKKKSKKKQENRKNFKLLFELK